MSLVTVQDFIETRFKTDVIWALKHAGQKHYAYVLDKHVLPTLGDVRLRDATSDHVQALVRTKFQAGYSVQTVECISGTSSARKFNHVKLKGVYHGDNPASNVRVPEMQRKETPAPPEFYSGTGTLEASAGVRFARWPFLSMWSASLNVAEMLAASLRSRKNSGS